MIFVISNLLILGCIPLRVAQLGSDHQYFRSVRKKKSAKIKTLSEFFNDKKSYTINEREKLLI
jgi:hypothetical protein